jgi:uncharacterized protein YndB with AHSA1/START domain
MIANSETFQVSTPSDREIVMTRVFNAPRALVFEAMTKPELIRQWLLGPPGWTMPVCEVDLRIGGAYRYVWRNQQGTDMGMGGVFREINPPSRIVQTERFDKCWYSGEAVGTLDLDERGGKTYLTLTLLYESKDARDTALKATMDKGVSASYNRLEELLAAQGVTR